MSQVLCFTLTFFIYFFGLTLKEHPTQVRSLANKQADDNYVKVKKKKINNKIYIYSLIRNRGIKSRLAVDWYNVNDGRGLDANELIILEVE